MLVLVMFQVALNLLFNKKTGFFILVSLIIAILDLPACLEIMEMVSPLVRRLEAAPEEKLSFLLWKISLYRARCLDRSNILSAGAAIKVVIWILGMPSYLVNGNLTTFALSSLSLTPTKISVSISANSVSTYPIPIALPRVGD